MAMSRSRDASYLAARFVLIKRDPLQVRGGIERGELNVSLINIERIAHALKISIPRLFKKV
jgi:hypothetical protein